MGVQNYSTYSIKISWWKHVIKRDFPWDRFTGWQEAVSLAKEVAARYRADRWEVWEHYDGYYEGGDCDGEFGPIDRLLESSDGVDGRTYRLRYSTVGDVFDAAPAVPAEPLDIEYYQGMWIERHDESWRVCPDYLSGRGFETEVKFATVNQAKVAIDTYWSSRLRTQAPGQGAPRESKGAGPDLPF